MMYRSHFLLWFDFEMIIILFSPFLCQPLRPR